MFLFTKFCYSIIINPVAKSYHESFIKNNIEDYKLNKKSHVKKYLSTEKINNLTEENENKEIKKNLLKTPDCPKKDFSDDDVKLKVKKINNHKKNEKINEKSIFRIKTIKKEEKNSNNKNYKDKNLYYQFYYIILLLLVILTASLLFMHLIGFKILLLLLFIIFILFARFFYLIYFLFKRSMF